MSGFVVVGTDTDAGKTAFSALVLAAFPGRFAYWKPVETGPSDTERIRELVPVAQIHPPHARFADPVAPALAARRAGQFMPGIAELLAAIPDSHLPLVVETFGGPLSPLTDEVLQLDWIRALDRPVVLVVSSAVGAIGRTLLAFRALDDAGLTPAAIVLIGPDDAYAREQICQHAGNRLVVGFGLPKGDWTAENLASTATANRQQLAEVIEACQPTQPDTTAWTEVDASTVWHPYTPLRTHDQPLAVVAARDEFLNLADGREVIDAISSWWTITHGHRHPAIMAAVRQATHTLDHVLFAGATHPTAIQLAQSLLESVGWPTGGRVFFSDNGSTAVEVALKMAYQYWCLRGQPKRTLFVGFEHGYHGDTFGSMAVGRDPVFFGRFEPLLFQAQRIPLDATLLERTLAAHPGEVAAIIVEPLVQGAGGMRMHSPDELRDLAEVTRRHDTLLIADEVMTGFGRTGSFWAHQQSRIEPNLICTAKGLTGGVLPLAATLVAPEVVAAFDTANRSDTFFHGHSFTANPIACAAAVASWQVMQTGKWRTDVDRIRGFWERHRTRLSRLPGVVEVRVMGVILAVELDLPGGYLADGGSAMRQASIDRGVMLRPLGNVLYAMPPYCTSEQSLERIVGAIEAAACGFVW